MAAEPGGLAGVAVHIAPATLNALYDQASDILLSRYWEPLGSLFALQGFLGDLGECRKPGVHYGVPLFDSDGQATSLNIPAGLLAECEEGSAVKVVGRVRRNFYRQAVQFRLEVVELVRAEVATSVARADGLTSERLRTLRSDRHPFPFSMKSVRISVICGKDNSVSEDFEKELRPLGDAVEVSKQEINVTAASAVAEAVEKAMGELVVLIRGGGDVTDMGVFDTLPVLEAMSRKACFRLIGIGHSKDRRLLDGIVDFAASTPAAAGRYVRDQLEAQTAFMERERREARHLVEARLRQREEAHARAVRAVEMKQHATNAELAHANELLTIRLAGPSVEQVEVDKLSARVRSLRWQRTAALALCAIFLVAWVTALLQPLVVVREPPRAPDSNAPEAMPSPQVASAARRAPARSGTVGQRKQAQPRNEISTEADRP